MESEPWNSMFPYYYEMSDRLSIEVFFIYLQASADFADCCARTRQCLQTFSTQHVIFVFGPHPSLHRTGTDLCAEYPPCY